MSHTRNDFLRTMLAASVVTPVALTPKFAEAAGSLTVRSRNLFPENMGYLESTNRFYIGSLRFGRISSVDANGTLATLCDDPRLVSTFGIFVDQAKGLIYACNADPGVGVRATPPTKGRVCGLATIDAQSGKIVRYVDIIGAEPGAHLPNDGALASDGSVYVTDTLSPLIHRIASDGTPEIFVRDERFGAGAPAPGLDGIAIASTGTIFANHISGGTLFRIDPATKAVSQVVVDGDALLKGCDGMRFEPDGRLIVAQGTLSGPSRNALCELTSSDDWKTATIAKVWPLEATTYQSVRTKTGVYGIQCRLEELFKNPETASVDSFTIVRISG